MGGSEHLVVVEEAAGAVEGYLIVLEEGEDQSDAVVGVLEGTLHFGSFVRDVEGHREVLLQGVGDHDGLHAGGIVAEHSLGKFGQISCLHGWKIIISNIVSE